MSKMVVLCNLSSSGYYFKTESSVFPIELSSIPDFLLAVSSKHLVLICFNKQLTFVNTPETLPHGSVVTEPVTMCSCGSRIVQCKTCLPLIVAFVTLLTLNILFHSAKVIPPVPARQPVNAANIEAKPANLKVLLLAYARTGSSLTGELLSLDNTTAFFFEPLLK